MTTDQVNSVLFAFVQDPELWARVQARVNGDRDVFLRRRKWQSDMK